MRLVDRLKAAGIEIREKRNLERLRGEISTTEGTEARRGTK